MSTRLKVAIVGCGKIADAHAMQIQRIAGCEIVGVCDREPLMAKQLCERFRAGVYFSQPEELLDRVQPDVVHVTTPPASHFELARLCLNRGCNVYVEKPFTLNADEALDLIQLAESRRCKITVGHNDQFSHVARRLRKLVSDGYLGDSIIHMESHYGYDLGDAAYARALLGDKGHWVRKLPGKLLQNVISHGVARIAEFLTGDNLQIMTHCFTSPLLKGIGENEIADELRVVISEASRTTAYFTFSSQVRPSVHEFRIYGSKNGLILDQDHDILLKLRGKKYKSFADKFIPPLQFARQHLDAAFSNMRLFLARDFHTDSGMKYLFEAFYESIRQNTPVPITYREILLTARIMDAIFEQMNVGCRELTMHPVEAGRQIAPESLAG
ncbi:MAG: Gfo/Idh/MocA family oxidoreductase [Terracidiphilus sp.]